MNKKAFVAHLLVPFNGTRPNDVQRMLQALHYPVAVLYFVLILVILNPLSCQQRRNDKVKGFLTYIEHCFAYCVGVTA